MTFHPVWVTSICYCCCYSVRGSNPKTRTLPLSYLKPALHLCTLQLQFNHEELVSLHWRPPQAPDGTHFACSLTNWCLNDSKYHKKQVAFLFIFNVHLEVVGSNDIIKLLSQHSLNNEPNEQMILQKRRLMNLCTLHITINNSNQEK